MPGLNLGVGGGIRFVGAGATVASAPPATIAQTSLGGAASSPSGVQYWHVSVGTAVAATLFLVFIRWTLPG